MHQHTCICLCYERMKVYVTDAFRCTGRYCFHGGPSFPFVVVCKWGLFQFKMTSLSRLKERKYCIKILHGIHLLNACTCTRHSYWMLLNAKIWHMAAALLYLVWPWGLILPLQISGCVSTVFACRSWTWLCLHATFHQQPREGKPEKEKQEQEKHK